MKPLSGLLIVAIEQAVAVPLCTARLVDAGARVIKVERTEGDFARSYDHAAKGESSYFAWLNQGKESVCLNFKQSEDATFLWSMLKHADVLIQNLSPGALARAGFSIDELHRVNKKLIICNVSGYGDTGPASDKRAYDLLVQAESGLISVSGSEADAGRIGVSICDIGAGITAYSAILEAIIKRHKTGEGEAISVSLFDVAAEWMTVPHVHAQFGDGAPKPAGLRHPSIAPYGAFTCRDNRLVLISIQNEREWERLCKDVLESEPLFTNTQFASNNERVKNREKLEAQINAITQNLSADEFEQRLQNASIAFGAINTASELAKHPAFRSRTATTAAGEHMLLPAHPVLHQKPSVDEHKRTPTVGQHTELVRAEFTDNE